MAKNKSIVYMGAADFRTLTAADLAKAGVETAEEFSFPRNSPVSVSVEIADALIEHPEIFGKFGVHEGKVVEAPADATSVPLDGLQVVEGTPETTEGDEATADITSKAAGSKPSK